MVRQERRLSPRVSLPYAARLWGVDVQGKPLKEDTVIDNLSTSGLYLHLKGAVPQSSHVHIAALVSPRGAKTTGLRLVASGIVVRTEPKPDGRCGVAIKFIRRRVL